MLLLLQLAFLIPAEAAENIQLYEQKIKAGLLYNFLKYTEWPAENHVATLTVCIFGADPMEGYLQPMEGRTVNQRTIALRYVQAPEQARACHLLFVNGEEKDRWLQLQTVLTGKSILTVSDYEGFINDGGMIEFGRTDNHIDVAINMDAVNAAKLRVHERLLKLATVVSASKQPMP